MEEGRGTTIGIDVGHDVGVEASLQVEVDSYDAAVRVDHRRITTSFLSLVQISSA